MTTHPYRSEPHTIEWVADITAPGQLIIARLVCTNARALLDFVVRQYLGPLDDSSRRCAAMWLEIQNQKSHILIVLNRRGTRSAKLRAAQRLEVA